jgi:hypothetical protein
MFFIVRRLLLRAYFFFFFCFFCFFFFFFFCSSYFSASPPSVVEYRLTKVTLTTHLSLFFIFWPHCSYTPPSNAFVGVTETILAGHNLTNHAFMGLTFSHTSWTLPSSSDGYVPSQTLVTPEGGEPVGAVHFAGSNGISFTNDTFAHIGAPYALSVGSASQGVLVDDCHFYDLSGGAVKIGNVDDLRAVSTRPVDQDRNMVVSRNRMSDVSVEYAGGAAVFAGYVANTTISHNEIRRTG